MSRTVTRMREERQKLRAQLRVTRAVAAILALLLVLLLLLGCGAARPAKPEAPPSLAAAAPVAATPTPDSPWMYRPAQEINAAEALAKTVWGEARGCSKEQQAAVVWCVLNRVDSEEPYFPDSIVEVVAQCGQFDGYDPDNPVNPDILALVEDVLARWSIEDICAGDVGRVLPREYLYFHGDGCINHFRTEYEGGQTWDWSLDSPYEENV